MLTQAQKLASIALLQICLLIGNIYLSVEVFKQQNIFYCILYWITFLIGRIKYMMIYFEEDKKNFLLSFFDMELILALRYGKQFFIKSHLIVYNLLIKQLPLYILQTYFIFMKGIFDSEYRYDDNITLLNIFLVCTCYIFLTLIISYNLKILSKSYFYYKINTLNVFSSLILFSSLFIIESPNRMNLIFYTLLTIIIKFLYLHKFNSIKTTTKDLNKLSFFIFNINCEEIYNQQKSQGIINAENKHLNIANYKITLIQITFLINYIKKIQKELEMFYYFYFIGSTYQFQFIYLSLSIIISSIYLVLNTFNTFKTIFFTQLFSIKDFQTLQQAVKVCQQQQYQQNYLQICRKKQKPNIFVKVNIQKFNVEVEQLSLIKCFCSKNDFVIFEVLKNLEEFRAKQQVDLYIKNEYSYSCKCFSQKLLIEQEFISQNLLNNLINGVYLCSYEILNKIIKSKYFLGQVNLESTQNLEKICQESSQINSIIKHEYLNLKSELLYINNYYKSMSNLININYNAVLYDLYDL